MRYWNELTEKSDVFSQHRTIPSFAPSWLMGSNLKKSQTVVKIKSHSKALFSYADILFTNF
jgi:hypothetical protein